MGFPNLDSFEKASFGKERIDLTEKLDGLNKSFKSGVKEVGGKFGKIEQSMGDAISQNNRINEMGNAMKEYFQGDKIVKTVENLGNGVTKTTSFDDKGTAYLKEITDSVAKTTTSELAPNIEIIKGNITTRTDHLGRVVGSKIEKIQLKETGARNDAELNSLKTNSTYLNGDQKGHLIPDRFGGSATKENILPEDAKINNGIGKRTENFAAKLVEDGHEVTYEKNPNYVGSSERPSSYDIKITVDGVDSKEFIKNNKAYESYADLPDKIYNSESFQKGEMSKVRKIATNVGEKVGLHHEAGMEQAAIAASVTCAISTVDNVSACLDGEITADEAAMNIAKDTTAAGAIGYGAGFVTHAVASSMAGSSNTLISSLGNSCVPAAAVSFGIASYDSVMDYAQGEIGVDELAYDLGENAVGVAGSIGGAALAGAAVGSIVPGAGTVVGAGVGLVGGMVGYAVTTAAYETAVEQAGEAIEAHSEEIKQLSDKAESIAKETINKASALGETAANDVRNAINDFNIQNALPFKV